MRRFSLVSRSLLAAACLLLMTQNLVAQVSGMAGGMGPDSSAGYASSLGEIQTTGYTPATTPAGVGQNYFHQAGCGCQGCGGGCGQDQLWATVTPYLWLPAMKGRVGGTNVVADVDLSLGDMFDLLGDLKGAAMLHTEIGKGSRGLLLDTMITDIASTEATPNGGSVTAETTMTFLEGMGFRRLQSGPRCGSWITSTNWDFLYGVRYYQVGAEVTAFPVNNPPLSEERTENWIDMVLGTRTSMQLANGASLFARADFGGFGIGSSSDFAWNLHVGVSNRLRFNPNSSVALGYKILDVNQSKSSAGQNFLYDINMHGPFAAMIFRF